MNLSLKVSVVIAVIVGTVFVSAAQEKIRRIEQPPKFIYANTPIHVAINMDGKRMKNREAKGGPDWLRKISLEVTNTTEKDINWLLINLVLREPVLGVRKPAPETAGIVITLELPMSEPKINILQAGVTVTLKPPANMVDHWTDYARQQGMDDIEKVILDIRQVGFTDGTNWYRGSYSQKPQETAGIRRSMLVPDLPSFFFDGPQF